MVLLDLVTRCSDPDVNFGFEVEYNEVSVAKGFLVFF